MGRPLLERRGSLHTGTLETLFACTDGDERVVGEVRRTIEIGLTDEELPRAISQGLRFDIRVPVTAAPRRLQVIVYDYAADLIGSVRAEVSGPR